jgi:predicted enzyme related to lactoylglutathione lyase
VIADVQINIDCADPNTLRDFYCRALGYVARGNGVHYTACEPREGVHGPVIVFQRVPEPKSVKNRLHLDLVVDDIEAEAARFVSLGAARVSAEPLDDGGRWIVMTDPEGNELCICDS